LQSYGGLKSEDIENFGETFMCLEKRLLTEKFSTFRSKRIHRVTDQRAAFKLPEIWPTDNWQSRALFT